MAKRTKSQTDNDASSTPQCGLCGKKRKLTKTQCCNNWICNDAGNYVMFSYARNSCWRNHDSYTICSYHYHNEHEGGWLNCQECVADFDTEDYVGMVTNEYNFVKLQNPPHFEPTLCGKCGRVIKRAEEGFSRLGDAFTCENCSDSPFLEPGTEEEYFSHDDWRKNIENYYAAKDWSMADVHLKYLHDLSVELLQKTFSESPLLDRYCVRALQCAKNEDSDGLAGLLGEIAEDYVMAAKGSRRLGSLRLNAFARALQSIDNNYLLTSAKGHSYSWLMTGIAKEAVAYNNDSQKIELVPMVQGFADTHRRIDNILRVATPEHFDSPKNLSSRQAAHYIADWLLQGDYNLFSKDTPERIATSCWQMLLERNPELGITGLTRKLLLEFGKWEDDGSFVEDTEAMQEMLEANMADPSILVVR